MYARTVSFSRIAFTFTAAGILSFSSLTAQTTGRGTATANTTETATAAELGNGSTLLAGNSVPSTTTSGWHETVVPADKQITAKITNGDLVVDGLVAKVHLNYDIHRAGYLYFFVPGVGTAIVSRVEMYGSTKVPSALHGNTLMFSTGGHDFELTSESALTEGKGGKQDVYVRLDTATLGLDRMPMLGFGSTTRAPYAWPLSGTGVKETEAHFVQPPPMPASALPRTISVQTATSNTATISAANAQVR